MPHTSDNSLEHSSTANTGMPELTYLALGDSYTIGECVQEADSWPVQLAAAVNRRGLLTILPPRIIATTGWRTDELQAAIETAELEESYDLVSLLIGVNNQYQGKDINMYETEFRQLLDMAVRLAGNKPRNVLVVSIPDYGYTPEGRSKREQISHELDQYNAIIRDASIEFGTMYVDITTISRDDSAHMVAGDDLHPSAYQYSEWVNEILDSTDFNQFLGRQAP